VLLMLTLLMSLTKTICVLIVSLARLWSIALSHYGLSRLEAEYAKKRCAHAVAPLLPACLLLCRSCYEVACDSIHIQDNYGAKLVSTAHMNLWSIGRCSQSVHLSRALFTCCSVTNRHAPR
jgi:hypothetical protein